MRKSSYFLKSFPHDNMSVWKCALNWGIWGVTECQSNGFDHTTHNYRAIKNIYNYGLGIRIKSIIGPINLLWSRTKDLQTNNTINNYFFSLGVNI